MFNRIVSDTSLYLEPFNFADSCQIELFDNLTMCKQMTDV